MSLNGTANDYATKLQALLSVVDKASFRIRSLRDRLDQSDNETQRGEISDDLYDVALALEKAYATAARR